MTTPEVGDDDAQQGRREASCSADTSAASAGAAGAAGAAAAAAGDAVDDAVVVVLVPNRGGVGVGVSTSSGNSISLATGSTATTASCLQLVGGANKAAEAASATTTITTTTKIEREEEVVVVDNVTVVHHNVVAMQPALLFPPLPTNNRPQRVGSKGVKFDENSILQQQQHQQQQQQYGTLEVAATAEATGSVTTEAAVTVVAVDDMYDYGSSDLSAADAACSPQKQTLGQRIHHNCCPHGWRAPQNITLILSFGAFLITCGMSWDCTYFRGATISFTGNSYGLWTLEDISGKCQLWDVLFFSYSLGTPLVAARVFSMAAMLAGLSLLTTMSQALQFHAISWTLGLLFLMLFLLSQATVSIFNVWAAFGFFTYLIYVLIVRYLFIHPYHRRISVRGNKIIAAGFVFCAVCCILTMVVLKSNFCTCRDIEPETLAGRAPGQPCSGTCQLGPSGYLAVVSCILWLASAGSMLYFGIQPENLVQNVRKTPSMYAHYSRHSITTQLVAKLIGKRFVGVSTDCGSGRDGSTDEVDSSATKPRGGSGEPNVAPLSISATTTEASLRTSPTNARRDLTTPSDHSNTDLSPSEIFMVSSLGIRIAREHREQQQRLRVRPEDSQVSDVDPEAAVISEQVPKEDCVDTRGRVQRFCCDYRVKPRTRSERWLFWTFRVVLGLVLFCYLCMLTLLIGQRVENTRAAQAPDTSKYFITPVVCAFNLLDPSQPFVTFPNKIAAHLQGYQVAHCGECGYCSNSADIRRYVETRTSIAKSAKKCGPVSKLGTYNRLVSCLEDRIGLSLDCTKCWANNMIHTGKVCLFTCMTTLFTGFMSNNNVPGAGQQGWLNQCLFCDEKLSGPGFVTCSGVARRRLGIRSEIERNPEEQCPNSDIDWVHVNWVEIGFAGANSTNRTGTTSKQ